MNHYQLRNKSRIGLPIAFTQVHDNSPIIGPKRHKCGLCLHLVGPVELVNMHVPGCMLYVCTSLLTLCP